MEAWRLHYTQLRELTELEGVDTFMVDIFSNLLRDSKWGMILRVSLGAFLSMLDGATDIYTISTYYESDKLIWQANAMLAMISINMVCQILTVLGVYQKHPWQTKLKEILICLTFLRPAVDAYRVSTNHEDKMAIADPLKEMMINKCFEVSSRAKRGGGRSERGRANASCCTYLTFSPFCSSAQRASRAAFCSASSG